MCVCHDTPVAVFYHARLLYLTFFQTFRREIMRTGEKFANSLLFLYLQFTSFSFFFLFRTAELEIYVSSFLYRVDNSDTLKVDFSRLFLFHHEAMTCN